MKVLLDTRVWIWMLSAEDRLTNESRTVLADPESELYLSAASVWEITIKVGAGKLKYSGSPSVQIPIHIKRSGVRTLPITADHVLAASILPTHHRDIIDRMLVAQAQADELTLATADERLRKYDVPIFSVSG